MSSQILAIDEVVSKYQSYCDKAAPKSTVVAKGTPSTELIAPILAVAEAMAAYAPPTKVAMMPSVNAVEPIFEVSHLYLQSLGAMLNLDRGGYEGQSVLGNICRAHDENLHSDFIAALLNPSIFGDFSIELIKSLVRHSYPEFEEASIDYVNVYREVRLDKVDQSLVGGEKGARRIDIVVEFDRNVLVIENKVDSGESKEQTDDYFNAVQSGYNKSKNLFFYLLSPSGLPGHHSMFKGLSYFNLVESLIECKPHIKKRSESVETFNFYFSELMKTVVNEYFRFVDRSKSYLKEHGYEF